MSLKSMLLGGVFLTTPLTTLAQDKKHVNEFDIQQSFIAAVESGRMPKVDTVPVGGLSLQDRSYEKCLPYDVAVQGSTASLYYCLDHPYKVVLEWHDKKSWTPDKKALLYQTLCSPAPRLKQ